MRPGVARSAVPAVLAAITVAAAAYAFRAPPAGRPEATRPAARAAVLSPRRVPVLLSSAIGVARLQLQLDRFLADPSLGGARQSSCLVVERAGQRLYDAGSARALTPASTLKLLTAAAVLRRLGPDATLNTRVVAAARPRDGVIDGDLWLVGGGDPLLGTLDYLERFDDLPRQFTDISDLAAQLRADGVRVVRGGVRGDESRYDTQRYLSTWKPGFTVSGNVGALSALAVNDGFAVWNPTFVASGAPATTAAVIFANALRAAGIEVEGDAGQGVAPDDGATLATLESHPVRTLIGEMLIHSDNDTAELLTKELGRRFGGAGTTSAGVGVIRSTLAAAGFDVRDVATSDGSGLDASDKLTCAALGDVLTRPGSEELLRAGLAIAGRTGTLHDQFDGNPAAGRLRAKSGALEGVVGLAGIVDAREPDELPLTFAFLANSLPGPSHNLGERLQERLGAALAAYPDAPSPEDLRP